MVNFRLLRLASMDELVRFPQFQRDRLFQHHILAGLQAVARRSDSGWLPAWSRCRPTEMFGFLMMSL